MPEDEISVEDLVENPTPRVPIALVLDTSGSMSGEPIRELNEGVNLFIDEIRNDEYTRYSAEICIITFGNTVRVIQDFTTVDNISYPIFEAGGSTPMGAAVLEALERLERRKSMYKELGIDYYQPWMVLMTDGKPTDDITEAVKKTQQLLSQRKLVVFPIAIGSKADLDTLNLFTTPDRMPLRLKGLRFKEFFMWLSKSVAQVSRSTPGQKVNLDIEGLKGWAEL
ncbi:MAG TPA: VWA domain-containing protein [Thermococcaceae archaeon]|nr:VWA domain-containing protein [Thermococcaceae archaeon]